MPKQLKTYFNSMADIIDAQAKSAGIFSGREDIGKCREIINQNFLQKHVPARFSVHLLPDKYSGQIDIIINHDMCATFKEHSIIRCPVESVIAAVSVKSKLDKSQIYDGLKNLASIPQINQDVLTTGKLTKPVNLYVQSWPSLYLFALNSTYISLPGNLILNIAFTTVNNLRIQATIYKYAYIIKLPILMRSH